MPAVVEKTCSRTVYYGAEILVVAFGLRALRVKHVPLVSQGEAPSLTISSMTPSTGTCLGSLARSSHTEVSISILNMKLTPSY